MDAHRTRQGVIFAFIAYLIWGIAPAYFKLIKQVPADEILTHRVIWSFFFMLVLLSVSRSWGDVRLGLAQPKKIGMFAGVLVQVWVFGSVPVIAIGLSLTFAFYGLLRKKIGVDSQTGMLIETLWLLPVAGIYLFFIAHSQTSNLAANPWSLDLLLMAAGIITTIPLLFFTAAAARLKLSTLGFFQYLGPTLMFLLAVVFYGETVNTSQLITFGFIWVGLLCFIGDALYTQGRLRRGRSGHSTA
ncbi:hypothetical protein SRABI106_02353 [Rahnella aquatilis]|nr:hypothetical protein SRABI106_02353 [Rahnella aquatilis]